MDAILLNEKKRIAYLDIAKGIGILLVMLGHIVPSSMWIHTAIYSFHMPLFFILSGMTMQSTNQKQSFFEAILHEKKLIIQYIIWSIFYIIFDLIIRSFVGQNIQLRLIFWDCYQTIVMYGINVLWFLSTLLLAKIIANYCKLEKAINVLLLLVAFLFIAAIGLKLQKLLDSNYGKIIYYSVVSALRPCMMLIFLFTGRVLVDLKFKWGGKKIIIYLALWLILMPLCGNIDYHKLVVEKAGISLIMALLGSLMVIETSKMISRVNILCKILSWLGKNSLLIMVTHEYLMLRDIVKGLLSAVCLPITIGSEFVALVLFEVLICIGFSKQYSRWIKSISNKMDNLIGIYKENGTTRISKQ